MKRNLFVAFFILLAFVCNHTQACTSAIISGKITPDGRPLLWKQRDTDTAQNSVMYFSGKRFSFVAIINSNEKNPRDIWIGTNSAGFSIMNTQSYNLEKVKKGEDRGSDNGRIMKLALEVCATVEDFKHFLDSIKKPSLTEANFGVIDAKGGAAMFETGYYKYTMYDVNNPKDAPYGYIARTNFSFAGEVNNGAGYVRYMQEDKILMPASATKQITPSWIFKELARSFTNSLLGIDLKSGDFNRPKTSGWFVDQDFIARKSTSCSVVVQGVKVGENAELTTMWTVLGYPPASVVVPVWVKGASEQLPALLARNAGTKLSPLCDRAVTLRDRAFSYTQGLGSERYFNWELIFNKAGKGYMQLLEPVEDAVFQRVATKLEGWRKNGFVDTADQALLYRELDDFIALKYKELFDL